MDPIQERSDEVAVQLENEMDRVEDVCVEMDKDNGDVNQEEGLSGDDANGTADKKNDNDDMNSDKDDMDNIRADTDGILTGEKECDIDIRKLTNGIEQLDLNDEHSSEIDNDDKDTVAHEVRFSNGPLTRRDFSNIEEIVYSSTQANYEINTCSADAEETNDVDVVPPTKSKTDPKDRKLLKRSRISENDFVVDTALIEEVREEKKQEADEIQTKMSVKEKSTKKTTKVSFDDRLPNETCLQRARRVYGRGYRPKGLTTKSPSQLALKRTTTDPPNKDGRRQQKQYFQVELHRLQSNLLRESSKIRAPVKKPFTPNTFNSLRPYYNTQTASYLIDLPEAVPHTYSFRPTALGLTDPWDDYSMDMSLLPPISRRTAGAKNPTATKKGKKGNKEKPCAGSTHLPGFPSVSVPPGDITKRSLFYSDVPLLRKELKRLYSDGAEQKVDVEFNRTVNDFFRMGLHRMSDYHPTNRPHMRACYFAYFQNNKGAKKAVYKCVKEIEKDAEPEVEDEQGRGQTCPEVKA